MILAQSATRDVGFVILAIVFIGFAVYVLFNLLASRREVGSEIELAPNRKPYFSDDILETRKLDMSLLSGLVLLSVIGLALPLYWLGEPGRQEGLVENQLELWTEDGAEAFEESCSSCHGGGGAGGVAAFALTDQASGEFVASVDWVAPSLTSVLTRFDEDEVRHILNFGRNGVMPAWGAPGGGPLTVQQVDVIIVYLRSIQKDSDAVQTAVQDGLIEGARLQQVAADPALSRALFDAEITLQRAQQSGAASVISDAQAGLSDVQRQIGEAYPNDAMAAWLDEISDPDHPDYLIYGKVLFANRADSGAYGCARCHTSGWSYDGANDIAAGPEGEILSTVDGEPGYVQGGGFFGPNLTGGREMSQFPSGDTNVEFIRTGSVDGIRYGRAGNGSGQMPGFSTRIDDDLLEEVFDEELGDTIEAEKMWPASLTEDQIAAVVAYVRSL